MPRITQICLDCGKKVDTKNKSIFGTWKAKCDMCGEEKACADAQHDFGYYNNDEERRLDRIADTI